MTLLRLLLSETRSDEQKPYEDPRSGLEYASYRAYIEGRDPIPHWRNAQIRRVRETFDDQHTEWRVGEVKRLYDRQGIPVPACERDEEVFRSAPHPYQPQCWLSSLAG